MIGKIKSQGWNRFANNNSLYTKKSDPNLYQSKKNIGFFQAAVQASNIRFVKSMDNLLCTFCSKEIEKLNTFIELKVTITNENTEYLCLVCLGDMIDAVTLEEIKKQKEARKSKDFAKAL